MEKKQKNEVDEFKFRSDEDLKKEVKKELNRLIKSEKKNKKKSAEPIKEISVEELFEKEEIKLAKEIELVRNMSDSKKIDWLIEKHESYTETVNWSLQQDFLNGEDYFSRYLIILYMKELITLLATYDFEFSNDMIELLIQKNQVELLAMLNVLNYL